MYLFYSMLSNDDKLTIREDKHVTALLERRLGILLARQDPARNGPDLS
jgi:hypothetical protein